MEEEEEDEQDGVSIASSEENVDEEHLGVEDLYLDPALASDDEEDEE